MAFAAFSCEQREPIYPYSGAPTNGNWGAVGTSYSIFNAGPNTLSNTQSGIDPGLKFQPIFSTNIGFTTTPGYSQLCSAQQVPAYWSNVGVLTAVDTALGVADTSYLRSTGALNNGLQSVLVNQRANQLVMTNYDCTATMQLNKLNTLTTKSGSNTLDSNFQSSTNSMIEKIKKHNGDLTNEDMYNSINDWVAQYGTHYISSARAGGVVSQICTMTGLQYAQAIAGTYSWASNYNSGVRNLIYGSGPTMDTQFTNLSAVCRTAQSPSPKVAQLTFGSPGVDYPVWLQVMGNQNAYIPINVQLTPLTSLFNYPQLWSDQNTKIMALVQQTLATFMTNCSYKSFSSTPSTSTTSQCPGYSSLCAPGAYGSGASCQSCFTSGPFCSLNPNSETGYATSGCTATGCSCIPPWAGSQCTFYDP